MRIDPNFLDVVIIGAGPAGLCCAIEAQRAGLSYVVLEKGVLVNSIYHFPTNMTFFSTSKLLEIGDTPFISHGDKPTRREALEYYRRIVQSYDLRIHYYEAVEALEKDEDHYRIRSTTSAYNCHSVIVATGFYDTPKYLNVAGEDLPKVRHYYDEAHPYVGQRLLIVGAANSACDVALETWQKGALVSMAIRGTELYKGVKYWIRPNIENRIREGSIQAFFETEVVEICPSEVLLKRAGQWFTLANDFVLAMTGYTPDYTFLRSLGIPIDDSVDQLPVFDKRTLETPRSNVYVAGVINAGLKTNALFIENTRDHGKRIIASILSKRAKAPR